ncbi:LysR family transcriptional regulator [Undibacterium terreum]|uniref:LysR family transcriptional regulator n=1 Tax=Undibacterium terreum TaxID=1224302 RepID=A0A916V065_9BURK|nr:LysR family transcriptional regulator [Undibacterium terreum]GGC99358.1 LysR family transcriptional regulator [Undibacterium terreum]
MLKLEGIAGFVAVAESGSISEAARRLQLSKSVVSERLADLEKTLNATLLHRTTRKISLTEDGGAFLERAKRIMCEVAEAKADMAERRGSLIGPLRISAPVTFGRMHLGPAIYSFLEKYPKLELTLDLNDRRVDAAADGYDAVVRHGPLEDSRLVAWHLAPSRRMLVASPEYLARNGTPGSIEDLKNHRGVFYTNRGLSDWRFISDDGPITVRTSAALRVNNGDVMRDSVLAGLGIALLPTFITGAEIQKGDLAVIDIGMEAPEESIYVAHPEGRRASAKLKEFAACLQTAIGTPPYWDAWNNQEN